MSFKDLGVHLHLVNKDTDPDDILEFSLGQSDARLQQQMKIDKIQAVQSIASRIDNKKEFIRLAKGKAKKMLQEQLEILEQKQFQLLRNEILNACKNGGLLDMKKLQKVPGFKGDILYKQTNKNKKEK